MVKRQEFVVGLDIGTTKICAMIGRRDGDGEAEIIGTGVTPSKGLRKGAVINLESTIDSVERAIEKAKYTPRGYILMAGCEVPVMTPPYNLYIMKKAIDDFGWYD